MHFITVYLKDGDNLGATNPAILAELAALLGTIRGPWIVARHRNITRQQLASSAWPSVVGGVVKEPNSATCNGKKYDFFVVSRTLDASVVAVTTLDNGGFSPHAAVRMLISGAARHKAVRRLAKPKSIGAHLPAGPMPLAINNFQLYVLSPTGSPTCTPGLAMRSCRCLGNTLVLSSTASAGSPPPGRLTKQQPGACEASAILRTLANRAREAARVHARHGDIP